MIATIAQLIGKVNPKLYASNFDELLKEYGSPDKIPADKIKEKPISEHKMIYDSSSETLEPVYFFTLDLMNSMGLQTEKLLDNFTSSPGSGHFSELGQRATIMQQQATKILGDVNTVLRSVLNIIYDLKEFRIRLSEYDALKTDKKEAAILSLKQVWMDKVDIVKGNSSIKAMALGQAGFQTLIDAFLFVKSIQDVDKVDLNDRVKRILRARVLEFGDWLANSESELRKRYELEKNYLKSQVSALKLYVRWAKPYLKAANELEMKNMPREPALVKTFNTIILELTLLGRKKIKVDEEMLAGKLPQGLEKLKSRDYFSCVLVDFKFRGIPQRISQQSHFAFGGRAEISFKSYALNADEIKKLDSELDDSDLNDALSLIEGITGESLELLQDEINSFLEEKSEFEKSGSQKDTSNPFLALFGKYEDSSGSEGGEKKRKDEKKKDKGKKKVTVAPETYAEKEHIRKLAEEGAKETTFKVFDVYKKGHGMPSYT